MSSNGLEINFNVHCHLIRQFESVFIVGNVRQLGKWEPDRAVELERDPVKNLWHTTIKFEPRPKEPLKFRYFIGYYLQASNDQSSKTRIVSRWEAQWTPRSLIPLSDEPVIHQNHEFGIYDGKKLIADGWLNHQVQTEVRLFLYDRCMTFYKERHQQRQYYIKITPFDLRRKEEYNPYNRAQKGRTLWRMSSVYTNSAGSLEDETDDKDASNPTQLPALPSFSQTEIAVLSKHDADPTFSDQKVSGQLYYNTSIFIFRTQSIAPEFLAFRIELFTEHRTKKPTQPPTIEEDEVCETTLETCGISRKTHNSLLKEVSYVTENKRSIKVDRVGIAYFMFSAKMDTCGQSQVPILAKNQMPIGQLKVDYLLIKALSHDLTTRLTMERCYTRHWKKRKTVEVGHRGFGNSYTKASTVRENTIHSLSHASQKGADFVEFDVQLTKDKIAVVFHDFHVLVAVAKRSTSSKEIDVNRGTDAAAFGKSGPQKPHPENIQIGNADYHEIAVKDLRLQQLRLLHVEHYQAQENKNMLKVTGAPDESDEHRPFPTLVDVLRRVPAYTGFNVEVKYPMELLDGSHECKNYFERNEFIDRILHDVIENAGTRRIVFSSFEPDICSMIARKQCLFPTLFLCVGATERYVPFVDKRSVDSVVAANFAKSEKILGCNFHSEELLKDRRPVERAKRLRLVSFVWGDDLDAPKNIDYFRRDLCVEGIIYDKIGETEERKNVFIVEREQRNSLFQSPVPSRRGSADNPQNITSQTNSLSLSQAAASLLLAGDRQKRSSLDSSKDR
ncbi:unnamed protein product [Bursaphelenchus okinawaensis]|uniref:GP-PDE domain-containing protein n=1 Tax=Bursaphelenchus okinawaensis TaxID=465554 RepID=A0A811LJC9_9BILA|nr:unnamed protein product [Bursaphelenchus okinawaensis]CAG9127196.1 unnamed protein product [Bursaphelenchus okinawaensis]